MNLLRIFASVFVGGLVTASTIILLNQRNQKSQLTSTNPQMPIPEPENNFQKSEQSLEDREAPSKKSEKTLKEKKSLKKIVGEVKEKKQRTKRNTEPPVATGELYNDFVVYQGAKGGKFYYDAKGVKKYFKTNE